jgi:hypothetical protein
MKSVRLLSFAFVVPTFALLASGASAQTAARDDDANVRRDPALPQVAPGSPAGVFGAKTQLTISSDAGFSISNTSVSGVDGSTTRVELRPAIDYFVMDNLSVGGFIGFDYSSDPGGHTTTFSIGPRVGYNLAFSERFSVWPKLGFSYATTSVSEDLTPPGSDTTVTQNNSSSGLALNLFVPVMFHPVPHFFLGFGPALDQSLTGDTKTTVIAGRLTIGGWI